MRLFLDPETESLRTDQKYVIEERRVDICDLLAARLHTAVPHYPLLTVPLSVKCSGHGRQTENKTWSGVFIGP